MANNYEQASKIYEHILNPYEHFASPYENLWIYYIEGSPEKAILNSSFMKNSNFIGNWEEDGFSFLFFSDQCDKLVDAIVEQDKQLTLIDRYEMTGEAWHGEKIESYISGNLCISPPWKIPFVNQPEMKHILLDPGVVFGTGRHPTTEDCLGYIEYICSNKSNLNSNKPIQNRDKPTCDAQNTIQLNQKKATQTDKETISTMLDIGTGTGLLAIAAAVLGCKKILAVDFNLLAVKTAHNNIRLNSLEDKILAVQGRAEDFVALPADLVVANIHYDVMRHLLEIPEFYEHKWLILSGLLRSEVNMVLDTLKRKSATVIETLSPDGVWNTILAKGK
ncbi:MAG: 50S ribosomal protein L11 methyltransferase [Desulfamplus sp.]|nr:50S ribosomal protein L11 methyltransferase [Desulfamplus sp.]